ncbi:MAG: DUF937 domain-containing protein [Pegethrix bostrychoides GSE-TBD4-15B]|uniref:DUF937 domain-containing protein n=1 Tax=Pegethrix bostrychoides GSE-TBD4-15B TaxID=2839662 RepID=A0A951PF50_9CYAN|nr:DUF937 domain-containing protein [Pegethrix bostrychoides GSE-TBD4-15B]
MGLFDQILGAVNNPHQQASPDQLGAILGTVQQLASRQGLDASATQTMLSTVGTHVRSALQQQRAAGGAGRAEAIVNQYGGTGSSADVLESLFSPGQQQQVAQDVAQRTGLTANKVLALLPILIPIVLNLLKQGSQLGSSTVPTSQTASANSASANTVLNGFLDADGDGDVDIGDAMSMAGRFLQR